MTMPQKKTLSEGLIAQLHGKGSMSEVLRIERQRLMEQAAEEMRVQLGGVGGPWAPPRSPGRRSRWRPLPLRKWSHR